MKREEIIRDLVERSSGAGAGQYTSIRCDVAREIIALLKEQEARVMTKNEVECDCPDCVYFETRTGWIECAIKDEYESDCCYGVFVYGCKEWFMRSYEKYGETWRCWTARPTEEQRKAVKWDE